MSNADDRRYAQFDSVLLATDFSEASLKAGLYASALSVFFDAPLTVVHAFTLLQASLEVEAERPRRSAQRKDLNHALAKAAEGLQAGQGATQLELLEGDPCRVIPEVAANYARALIVMGTHGRGTVDRFFLGSTAEQILRHSRGPALTVGPNVDIARAERLNVRRILYATDGAAETAHAAPFAAALSEAFAAPIDVLNVVDPDENSQADHPLHLQRHLQKALRSVVPDKADEFSSSDTFVSFGNPQAEILKHIKDREIDLLVMGLRRNAHLGMKNRTSGVFPIVVSSNCPVNTVASGSIA